MDQNIMPILLKSVGQVKTNKFIVDYLKSNSIYEYNVYRVTPEKEELSIAEVREVKKELVFSSTTARLIIFERFESASIEAQNALLKTLEERNHSIHYILIASRTDKILPTVLSRTKLVELEKPLKKESKMSKLIPEIIASIKKTPNDPSLSSVTGFDRKKGAEFMMELLKYYQIEIADDRTAPEIIKKILATLRLFENNNLNPQLTVDNLLIYISKRYRMK